MKRFLALALGLALALAAPFAFAAWSSSGSGAAVAAATSVNQGHTPVAARGSGVVTLTWTASTLASGAPVSGYTVLRHGGSTTTVACSAAAPAVSCDDTAPVATGVTYGVVPTVGAHWTGPESALTSFTYDNVAPTTTASVSPLPNAAGWNKVAVTVTLSATDPAIGSGVDHVTYTVDAGTAVDAAGSTASFPVSGVGTHTVTFFAVDAAGNAEGAHAVSVKIDPDAPLIVNPQPADGAAGSWATIDCGNADRVCADVTDATSGIAVGTATFSLTGSSGANAGKCWNGAAFVAGTCAQQPMSVISGNQYGGTAALTTALMSAGAYTLVVSATDVAGNVSTATSTFSVKADQTITFTSAAPANATVGGATYAVGATATSGLAVTFTSATASVCTLNGPIVTFVGAGTCTIIANQAGNATFNAAPQVQQSFAVKTDQTISFTPPTTPAGAGTSATLVATATSGLAVTFSTSSAATICTVSVTTVTYVGAGTCTINANQAGNGTYNAAPQVTRTVSVTAAFAISGRSSGSPQNTTTVSGTGNPGATVTVYICTGTQSSCGAGGPSLVSNPNFSNPQTATVAANGTWSVIFSKLVNGAGTFTVQAVQSSPSLTSSVLTFTTS